MSRSKRGVDVEERPVDARVVHLARSGCRALNSSVFRRQEVLRVVLAVDRPDEPVVVVVDPEVAVARGVGSPSAPCSSSSVESPGRPVAHPERRLVVPGVAPLPERQVVVDGRMPGRACRARVKQ